MTSRRYVLTRALLMTVLAIVITATIIAYAVTTATYCTAANVVLTRAEKLLDVVKYIETTLNVTSPYVQKLVALGQELINKSRTYLELGNCSLALQYAIRATIVLNKAYAAAIAKSYIAQRRIMQNLITNYTIFMWRWTEKIYAQTMNKTRLVNRTELRHKLKEIVRTCIMKCGNLTGLRKVRCILTCLERNVAKAARINATIIRKELAKRFVHIVERRLRLYIRNMYVVNTTIIKRPEIINGTCKPGIVKVCIERPVLNRTICRTIVVPCNKTELEKIEKMLTTLYENCKREMLRLRYIMLKLRLLERIYKHMNMTLNITRQINITTVRAINLTKYIERLEKALHVLRHRFEERLHNIERIMEILRRHYEKVRRANVTSPAQPHHKITIEHKAVPINRGMGNLTCTINVLNTMYGECISTIKYTNCRGHLCIVIVSKNETCEKLLRSRLHGATTCFRVCMAELCMHTGITCFTLCILRPGTSINKVEIQAMPKGGVGIGPRR